MLIRLPMKKMNFCRMMLLLTSKLLKVCVVVTIAFSGLMRLMPTIMIGKMEIELPAMYIMRRFIGIYIEENIYEIQLDLKGRKSLTPLTGPSATSHDFLLMS